MGFWVRQSMLLTSRKATQYDVGVNFFPLVLSAGIVILTIILLIKNIWIMRRSQEASQETEVDAGGMAKFYPLLSFFIVFILLLVYIVLLDPLGYAISTFIFLIANNLILTRLTYRKFLGVKAYAYRFLGFAVFSFGLPYVFRHVFRLILP